jgi:hypothetical protein
MFPWKLLPCRSLRKTEIFPNDEHLVIYICNMHMISEHSQYSTNSIISHEVVIRVFRHLKIKANAPSLMLILAYAHASSNSILPSHICIFNACCRV